MAQDAALSTVAAEDSIAEQRLAAARLERQATAERLEAARAERWWQRTLLPFMMLGIAAAAVFFGSTTFLFFDRLQSELAYGKAEAYGLINRVDGAGQAADPAYRDWAVRATLEQAALQQRYNVQVAIVKGRLWARFMGFLTGMILALTGCVFVLGKLRTDIDFSASGSGATALLKTSSPGVYLALLGTVIISLALAVPGSVEGTDAPVYFGGRSAGAAPGTVAAPPVALADGPASAAGAVRPPYPSPFAAPFALPLADERPAEPAKVQAPSAPAARPRP